MNSFLKTSLSLAIILLVGGMLFYVYEPKVAEAGWYATGGTWSYRKVITINNGKVEGMSDLTNFPILVDLTDADLATYAQADGDDILFTSSDGSTKLDHEIELYTTATGRLTAWVEIPTLDYDNDTVIYMYYGNSGASNQQNVTGTWDSNYKGVWHLNEGDSTAAGFYLDSTSNNNDGTLTDADGDTASVAGKMGNAMDFNGDADSISVGNSTSLDTGDIFTISAWVDPDTNNARRGVFTTRWSGSAGAWQFELGNALGSCTTDGRIIVTGVATYIACTTGSVFNTTALQHIVITKNGTAAGDTAIYYNGALQANAAQTAYDITDNTSNKQIGGGTSGGNLFDGIIDEVRYSNTPRSADWISTEYNNQSATSTFYSISIVQTAEPEDIKIRGGGSATNSNLKIRGGTGGGSVKFR